MGRLTFSYNGSNQLQSILGPGGRSVSVTINGSGNLTALQNPDGSLLTFTYDGSNRYWLLRICKCVISSARLRGSGVRRAGHRV